MLALKLIRRLKNEAIIDIKINNQMLSKKRIIVTAGEPSSISTEITVKSLQDAKK